MTPRFACFTRRARRKVNEQFTSLMGLLWDPAELTDSFGTLKDKAPGVDGVRKADYAVDLGGNVASLSSKLRRLGYKPQPVRRVYIQKGRKGKRPLGIPAFECRIVQDRLSRILQAIWEPEFQECSYGFRPHRNAHQALRRVAQIITCEHTQFVVDADIKGFFDNVDHDWMMRFIGHRIKDPNFKRIIHRFLKAGVMEDGAVTASESGTPQGGLVSPVLANIYLHYVLDLWFEKRFAKQLLGKAKLVRYADDFIVCFQSEREAHRFMNALRPRLARFGLELSEKKTRLIRFGSGASRYCRREGHKRPQTFNFLGFTHYETKSRSGRFKVGRKTQRERFSAKLVGLGDRLARLRSSGGSSMMKYTIWHLRGHFQYYGVSDNLKSLHKYHFRACHLLFKWLNRRSQRRSLNWDKFWKIASRELPQPRIVHRFYPLHA
ncbi:MAG: group II intron reverse transcriptase/maturase [Desulfobacterales bacterium]|nr:group II intron reverse transcriptase/maturase [Desulfobacterales bacterium]